MKKQITEYFERNGEEATVKYIDPSYTVRCQALCNVLRLVACQSLLISFATQVRSVPANAADSLYCLQLAQNAVHGAMAGHTGFSVGLVNNHVVYLPIPQLVATSPRSMNPHGQMMERILAMTGQPHTAVPLAKESEGERTIQFPRLPEPMLH
jgi:6-phosphofructokinase 1